uniref:MADS-box domain-containing protein n=1 Tax=Oryza punctata TaxID=4537 RepID=A0A0E0JVX2_ORYPU
MTTTAKAAAEMDVVGGGEGRRRKRTRGRQKIEMKLIENKDARQVCFSKRREGVFKKASELSVLCGARVAVVFFSPAGRPHCFGHPSVHAVADRFLLGRSTAVAAVAATAEEEEEAVVREFNRMEERLTDALEAEARRRDALDEAARAAGVWDDADVRRAGLADLLSMLAALERVQAEVSERVHEIIVEETMTHYTAAAAANIIDYLDAGPFVSHSPGSHDAVVMEDTTVKLVGGDVVHAPPPPPFAPMIMPPPLPAQFSHGFGYSDLAAGYGYNNLDYGHGAACETEGFHNATACDFF